jgi:peptidyl-prolyl cis-trans isomerase SurA
MTMRSCFSSAARRGIIRLALLAILVAAGAPIAFDHAEAQAIALAVNGDPITNIDIEQRMKLLRAIHRPATRDAAIESMIGDRLAYREVSHYGVTIKDSEIGEQVTTDAAKMKITPQALLAEIERAGVQKDHYIGFFKSELGFTVLVKAMNKGVEASEVQVRAELAKAGGKSSITQYTIRQVVFTLNPGDSPAAIGERAKQAEALRARFANCTSGLAYAKTLQGVAVREPLTRSSTSLSVQLKEILDKTPLGHLTPPSRSSSGLEMVAVCERGAAKDDTELRKTIADRILQAHFDADAATRLKDLRSRAIIEKR